jgi:hypothetical protein
MRYAATFIFGAAFLVAAGSLATVQPASAITADLAKKCRELAVKAHPPVVAGSKAGSAQAERDFFRTCVAQGGNVNGGLPKDEPKK